MRSAQEQWLEVLGSLREDAFSVRRSAERSLPKESEFYLMAPGDTRAEADTINRFGIIGK